VAATALVALLLGSAQASAAPQAQPYGAHDAGGFRNVLPAGENGFATLPQIVDFLSTGARPPHSADQIGMYRDLAYSTPGLAKSQIASFYKDATFGVKQGDEERAYTPDCDVAGAPPNPACEQVTIVRDKGFGVPHVYGENRSGAMFGAGYVGAEDRLFFMDVERHAGRSELSSFIGGSSAGMDRSTWRDTPYTEAELQQQFDRADETYGRQGAQLQRDVVNYVDGVNEYIAEAKADPAKLPGEYPALGHPAGPDPWKVTDVIATASLVAGIFGKGGGNEVNSAQTLQAAEQRFGAKKGKEVWADFRSANDPEAPTTIHKRKFPYEKTPKKVKGLALPDAGSVEPQKEIVAASGSGGPVDLRSSGGMLGQLGELGGASNALLVSARESKGGHPTAVMGPQVGYFNPQILMEIDIHAPKTKDGPPIDARGAAFTGVNQYVQLGHGRNYAWSATSAGQDIIDTFAVALCNPDGSAPTLDSDHYVFRGQCLPFDLLKRTNTWTPNPADSTPAGSETLQALRTKLGIVTSRATIDGQPVAYTKLRDTYFHEVDSARGFAEFNNPEKMSTPRKFMSSACKVDYTFNWLYANQDHIAYFNSGKNPVRAKNVDPNFPTLGTKRFEWRNFNPNTLDEKTTSCGAHPHITDQRFLTSWNNKHAPAFRAADDAYDYSSIYRVKPLDDRIRARIKGSKRISLQGLIDSMEDAGSVDLRGDAVLPWLLRVVRTQPVTDPELQHAVDVLSNWYANGAHRLDRDRNGTYEFAEAVRIMDAWWPRLVDAQFKPTLGDDLFDRLKGMIGIDNAPSSGNGSAYQTGWYGYAQKDLRTELGEKVKGRYSRKYCGGGGLSACRDALLASLKDALAHDSDAELYPDGPCGGMDAQACGDAIHYSTTGGISQPVQPWINRPTFQQAVQVP
jgi:acyl-homoserine lactone acylase PvdQ